MTSFESSSARWVDAAMRSHGTKGTPEVKQPAPLFAEAQTAMFAVKNQRSGIWIIMAALPVDF